MPQQRIGSTARTLSSTDTDRNPRQTGCPQLVASYDTQEDTLGLFYTPGPTGGKKVWEMIRKISGNQSNTTIHHLENNDGTKITERVDIANRLAEEIRKNSSSNNYRTEFQKYKEKSEKEHLDFDTDNSENYNVPFTIRELCDAMNKSHDTATGRDEIHYQLLKHLPRDSLMVLLDIFNDIWASGEIPECWKDI